MISSACTRLSLVIRFQLAVALGFAGAATVQAQDFWEGAVSDSWINGSNWADGTAPIPNADVHIDDVTLEDTCIFDRSSALTVRDVRITGASPTKMTLFVRDSALTASGLTELNDYAQLLADKAYTSASTTTLSGDIWVDIAPNATSTTTVALLGRADVDASGVTVMQIDDNTYGVLEFEELYVDAGAVSGTVGLKFQATDSIVNVTELLNVIGSTSSDNYAKLWLASGTLKVQSGDTGNPAVLQADGGSSFFRSADLDIDATLDADKCDFSGYVAIDVASGLTAYGGEVVLNGGGKQKKSGSGVFKSGVRP